MGSRMVYLVLSASLFVFPAFAEPTIRIALIDPLSGGGASIGDVSLKTFQYLVDELNANGGRRTAKGLNRLRQ